MKLNFNNIINSFIKANGAIVSIFAEWVRMFSKARTSRLILIFIFLQLLSFNFKSSMAYAEPDGTGSFIYNLGNDAGDDFEIDTDTFVVEGDNANVGIGTSVPSDKLHVSSGDARVGEGTFDNTSANPDLYVTGNVEVDGTLYGDISYSHTTYPTVRQALDYLLYVAPTINSFTNDADGSAGSTSYVENGTTINSTDLAWSLNKTVTSISINQGIGALSTAATAYTHVDTYTTDRTYTISVSDGTTSVNRNTTIDFRDRRYTGVSSSATLNDAAILGLANGTLATSETHSFSITAAAEYIYVVYPVSWGTASFTVNGLANTDWSLVTQNHTNASGATVNYNVYRTNNLLTGTYSIGVNQ